MIEVMDAVQSGLAEAKASGVDLFRWRSVITQMAARYEDRRAFDESAEAAGLRLTTADRRWSSIAIFRKAYRMARQRGYPGKLLMCSIRRGPSVDGVERMFHLEMIAGGSVVYTLPPPCLEELWELDPNLKFETTIDDDVPEPVLEKLLQVRYFADAYDEEMEPARFATLAPMVFTMRQFSAATETSIGYVRQRIGRPRQGGGQSDEGSRL
jgi:transaldolase